MTMSSPFPIKTARGRGPADGRAFFERLWRGNFFLDRQKTLKRSRRRKLKAAKKITANRKAQNQQQQQGKQHCCCCQRTLRDIQLHLLAERRNSVRSVIR